MTLAIKKMGAYTKNDERKHRALKRLIEENGALHIAKILRNVLGSSNDRHQQIMLLKLNEAVRAAEEHDSSWEK